MSLVSQLKSNVKSAVNVDFKAPTVMQSNSRLPLSITLSADTDQTVNSLKVWLKVTLGQTNVDYSIDLLTDTNRKKVTHLTIAELEQHATINIKAKQPKTLSLDLPLGDVVALSSPTKQIVNLVKQKKLRNIPKILNLVAGGSNTAHPRYALYVQATVAGSHLKPSQNQIMQLV